MTTTKTNELFIDTTDPKNVSDPNSNYNYSTIAQDVLPNQLDSISWNPVVENLFVLGTYEIDTVNSERRVGKIHLCELQSNIDDGRGYQIVHTVNKLPGILDLKWESEAGTLLAAASSSSVSIYKLGNLSLFPITSIPFDGPLEMALYIQWMDPINLIYSTSTGMICMWNIQDRDGNSKAFDTEGNVRSGKFHEYFVWFVHYDKESKVIYSGDDCGQLCAIHLDNFDGLLALTKKQFDTGVTSILTKDDWLFVGCYDEKLRIFQRTVRDFDKKIILPKQPLQEIDLGGTVWRTMWMPKISKVPEHENLMQLAVAAGRNGIHFLSLDPDEDWSWKTQLSVLEFQGDLAYGLDLKIKTSKQNDEDGDGLSKLLVGTCYFDSHRLHIFEINLS